MQPVLNRPRLLVRLFLATVAVVSGNAQAPAKPESVASGFKISDNVDFVLLDISVRNPGGGFVPGLGKQNFKVFEDGQAREIRHFGTFDGPATIGLVVDNSGSMANKRPEVVTAGLMFAKSSNKRDQFFVIDFNDSVTRGLPPGTAFTDNLQMLRNSLYFGQAQGQTALYDAVDYALKHLERASEQRRTLIVVSDGRDNASKISFSELMKDIGESRATVYTIGLYDPSNSDSNSRVLRKIAGISGGELFEPKGLGEIAPTFETISDDVRHRYTIGYVPDEENDKRQARQVRVVAHENDHKLRVRCRSTYRIPPSANLLAGVSASNDE